MDGWALSFLLLLPSPGQMVQQIIMDIVKSR